MLGPLLNLPHMLWWQPEEKNLLVEVKMVKSRSKQHLASIGYQQTQDYSRNCLVKFRLDWFSLTVSVMNGCEAVYLTRLLSIFLREKGWGQAYEKWRRGAKIEIILPKAPQSADWKLDPRHVFAQRHWKKIAHNNLKNSVTELDFKQEGSLMSPLLPVEITFYDWVAWHANALSNAAILSHHISLLSSLFQ